MEMAKPIEVGQLAPPFQVTRTSGRLLSSAELGGRPWVLAFVRAWQPDVGLPALRAELRGLGAVLVVLSERAAWSFHPDDEIEFLDTEIARSEAPAAARAFGVGPEQDALFVIDEGGRVRFAHGGEDSLAAGLAEALAAAGRALVERRCQARVDFNRREWTLTCLVAGFAVALLSGCRTRSSPPAAQGTAAPPAVDAALDVVLRVNGRDRALRIDPRTSLLDALRERLGLTGSKKGCDHGQCGACTVLVGGRAVNACLTLAVMAQGVDITTVEGLARGDQLHPVQAAFVAHDGFQCGYCTPGQIMSAVALLAEGRARTDAEVREQMSGNLCRCGAYPNIVAAIQAARKARPA